MASAGVFTESCAPIQLLCVNGATYTNPCTCQSYMECLVPGNKVIIRQCANGLLWDHITKQCRLRSEVIDYDRCEINTPWTRCKDIPNSYSTATLRQLCTGDSGENGNGSGEEQGGNGNGSGEEQVGNGNGSGVEPGGSGSGSGGGSGGSSTGAIVGGIIGGILVIAIIIGIFIYMKKKKRFVPATHRSNAYTMNPESKDNRIKAENDDEIYDVIDEKAVTPGHVGYPSESFNPNLGRHHGIDNPALDLSHDKNLPRDTDYSLGGPIASQPSPGLGPQYRPGDSNTASSLDEDLSRSITIDGMELQVQDAQGYAVGYPSGSIPRQKKHAVNMNDSSGTSEYFILEKQQTTGDYANN